MAGLLRASEDGGLDLVQQLAVLLVVAVVRLELAARLVAPVVRLQLAALLRRLVVPAVLLVPAALVPAAPLVVVAPLSTCHSPSRSSRM